TAAGDASGTLVSGVGELGAALDGLRATAGWSDWLLDVPPCDIDVAIAGGRLGALGRGVAAVAAAFRAADPADARAGRPVTVGDEDGLGVDSLGIAVGVAPSLLRVGDMLVVDTTALSDHVTLSLAADGHVVVTVDTLGPFGGLGRTRFDLPAGDPGRV